MKQINLKEMYSAGVHLGSSVKKLNPKMKPYIMCTHDGIAIIDILKVYTRLFRLTLFLKKIIATEGYRVLFVGTQKAIAPIIAEIATKCSSPYVNQRWKGGFLTNFKGARKIGDFAGSEAMKTNPRESIHETPETNRNQDTRRENRGEYGDRNRISGGGTEQFSESNELTGLPDLVIIVGQEKELKAIKECEKLNIPTITILDTDGDPEKTSLFIPANDDSQSSVEYILKHLGQSILVGRLVYDKKKKNSRPDGMKKSFQTPFRRKK